MIVASLRQDCWCPDRNPIPGTSRNEDLRQFAWLGGTLTIAEWRRRITRITSQVLRPLKSTFRSLVKGASYCSKSIHSESIGIREPGALYKEALQTASPLSSQLDFRLANRSILPLTRTELYTAFRSRSSIGWSSQYRIANGTALL